MEKAQRRQFICYYTIPVTTLALRALHYLILLYLHVPILDLGNDNWVLLVPPYYFTGQYIWYFARSLNLLYTTLFLSFIPLPPVQLRSMPTLFYVLLSPILLVVSIPLSLFAALTTSVAFTTLFFRAFLIYAELGGVLIQNQFVREHENEKTLTSTSATTAAIDGKQPQHKRRRSSAGSGSSGGSTTPKVLDAGFGIYSGGGVVRDFEGVGGWRVPGTDNEDATWTSLNSRLELPAMVDGRRRNHHRSRTSGSLTTVSLPLRSPVRSRARTPTSVRVGGSPSLEEYFANRAPSKSTNALDAANIRKSSSAP